MMAVLRPTVLPVFLTSWLQGIIVCQPIAKHGKRIAKSHVATRDCPLQFSPLAFDLFQIPQPKLGDGQLIRFERAANQLALNPYS
jgi:hypothetical protein